MTTPVHYVFAFQHFITSFQSVPFADKVWIGLVAEAVVRMTLNIGPVVDEYGIDRLWLGLI